MKVKILIPIGFFLLLLPMCLSITQDPRTLNNVMYYTPNYTNCQNNLNGLAPVPVQGHCENDWFFVFTNGSSADISIQIIPAPNMTCYFNNSNCPTSGFQFNMTFHVSRLSTYVLGGWASFGGKPSNHSVDVEQCWNWWNTTDKELRDYQKSLCPITTVSFSKWDKGATFEPYWSTLTLPFGTATPDAYMSFRGYGGTMVNMDDMLYNRRGQALFTAIKNYMEISVSLWTIIYYLVVIIYILIALFFILGVLPMGLRWIIKKITED